ncbi:MAG: hypothetical protein JXR34_07810 [Bacteroidales bacterium]|nr:hypothetical protein [Bacteroidales bacterium]
MNKTLILLLSLFVLSFIGCQDDFIPKPVGLFRIDIPKYEYVPVQHPNLPYTFDAPDYVTIKRQMHKDSNWINIEYDRYKATLFLTFHYMDTTLASYIEDCHDLAYKHTPKATNILPEPIIRNENNVYGLLYFIEGNEAASPLNFYLTDSVNYFFRGALYFNIEPRNDSLQPVIQTIEKDVMQLVNSFKFKKPNS